MPVRQTTPICQYIYSDNSLQMNLISYRTPSIFLIHSAHFPLSCIYCRVVYVIRLDCRKRMIERDHSNQTNESDFHTISNLHTSTICWQSYFYSRFVIICGNFRNQFDEWKLVENCNPLIAIKHDHTTKHSLPIHTSICCCTAAECRTVQWWWQQWIQYSRPAPLIEVVGG